MRKGNEIMEVEIPGDVKSLLTEQAQKAGIPAAEFAGIQTVRGACGELHEYVIASEQRATAGESGPSVAECHTCKHEQVQMHLHPCNDCTPGFPHWKARA